MILLVLVGARFTANMQEIYGAVFLNMARTLNYEVVVRVEPKTLCTRR
jgi:hypothetical protein